MAAVFPAASVTVTVKLRPPAEPTGGVPDSTPAELSESHEGSPEPDQLNGVVPPLALRVAP